MVINPAHLCDAYPCSAEEGVKVMEMMDRFTKKN